MSLCIFNQLAVYPRAVMCLLNNAKSCLFVYSGAAKFQITMCFKLPLGKLHCSLL